MEALHLFTIFIQLLQFSTAAHIDTITPDRSLKDDANPTTTLISLGETFELGLFSPGNSKNRYLGIWYKRKPDSVVWVAKRNSPLIEANREFTIREGKLVLLDRIRSIISSPTVSNNVANSSVALLLNPEILYLEQEKANRDCRAQFLQLNLYEVESGLIRGSVSHNR